jgi:hypothetical protein
MTSPDLFTLPHKALRAFFGTTATAVGSFDAAEVADGSALALRVHELVGEVLSHGEHEDEFVLPLLRRHLPHLDLRMTDEHRRLVAELDALRLTIDVFEREPAPAQQLDLYRHLRRVEAANLAHLDLEETIVMPALWAVTTAEDLAAVLTDFTEAHPDAVQLYRRVPDALTSAERALVLAN